MRYCINPWCEQRQNIDHVERCHTCGNRLLINERYRLVQPLHKPRQENYTEIFEVDDRGTPKILKVLKEDGPRWVEMLKREATVLSNLQHSGIPRVEPDGYFALTLSLPNKPKTLHCLVMEKIEGQNLEQWLQQNQPLTQNLALVWLQQLVEILDLLHENRFFHRDIKPSNIMLQPDGHLVLEKFLKQLGVQQTDAKLALSTTFAIGKAAIRYFIEQDSTMEEAQQIFAEEEKRREPEFKEVLKGGPNKVVDKLREIDRELHERYGLPRMYDDDKGNV